MHEINNIDLYKSIDGNLIKNPVGYCTYHKGYVSDRQAKVHRCFRKHGGTCGRLKDMEGRHIRKVKTEVFYDKMLDRMDKMITAMNKLTRTLEAIEKAEEQAAERMNKYSDQLNEMA